MTVAGPLQASTDSGWYRVYNLPSAPIVFRFVCLGETVIPDLPPIVVPACSQHSRGYQEPNCFRSFWQFLCPNSRVCSSITSSGLVNVGCAVNCHWLTNRRPMKHPMEFRMKEKLLQLQRRKTKGRKGGDRLVMMEGGEEMIGHAWLADLQNARN